MKMLGNKSTFNFLLYSNNKTRVEVGILSERHFLKYPYVYFDESILISVWNLIMYL